jgi:hypothetical protein
LTEILATEAAQHLGLTNQAIGQWCAKPGAPVRKEGRKVWVRWPDFARWREQQLVSQAKKEAAPKGSFVERKLAAEARSAEIQMERDEIALAREQSEALAVEDYENAIGVVIDRLTARLRAMPVRLSHLGPEVEAAAEQEAERIVNELHGWDEDVVDEGDNNEEAA